MCLKEQGYYVVLLSIFGNDKYAILLKNNGSSSTKFCSPRKYNVVNQQQEEGKKKKATRRRTMERIGDDVCPYDEYPIFPRNIWKNISGSRGNGIVEQIARRQIMQTNQLKTLQLENFKREIFEVRMLTNVNVDTNVITRYKLSKEKKDVITMDIMTEASSHETLTMYRENYGSTDISHDDRERLKEKIRIELLRICWGHTARWITERDEVFSYPIGKILDVENFTFLMTELELLVQICKRLDVSQIVKTTRYDNYGNCVLCFGKGRCNTRCQEYSCSMNMYGRIVIFKNMNGAYINPTLIHYVLGNNNSENPDNITKFLYDSASPEICLPLENNEYTETSFICMNKLLWYAQMYDSAEKNNLKHVMNEVVTTFDVMQEMYYMCEHQLHRFGQEVNVRDKVRARDDDSKVERRVRVRESSP